MKLHLLSILTNYPLNYITWQLILVKKPTNSLLFSIENDDLGWVCCWLSPLLQVVFLRVLRFSPLLEDQHFQIPIRSGTHRHVSLSECFSIPKCSVSKEIIITIYNFIFRIYAEIEKLRKRKAKQRPSIVRRFSSRRNLSFRRNRSLRKKREGEQDKEVAPKVINFNTVF